MTRQEIIIKQALEREELRKNGVDIEVQVIVNVNPEVSHTGKYRYIISYFDENKKLIKNYYSDVQYDDYLMAEQMAILLAQKRVM